MACLMALADAQTNWLNMQMPGMSTKEIQSNR